MFTRYFIEKKIYALFALVLFAVLLAGCGGKPATTTTTSVNNSLSQHVVASPSVSGGATAIATLKRQPVGNVNLSWNPTDHMMTVQLMLTGLAPNSVHPIHID